MKKSTKYILEGVMNEDEKTFLNRIGEILEKNDLVELMANGMPVSAVITDEAALLAALESKFPKRHNISVSEDYPTPSIDGRGRVSLRISYTETRYFKTEEDAKRGYPNNCRQDGDYQIPSERKDSDTFEVTGMDGINVLYV